MGQQQLSQKSTEPCGSATIQRVHACCQDRGIAHRKKAWYLQVSRLEQICLGKTMAEADRWYREWVIEQGASLPETDRKKLTIAEIAREFLDFSKSNNSDQRQKPLLHRGRFQPTGSGLP